DAHGCLRDQTKIWSLRCKKAEHRLLGGEERLRRRMDKHPRDLTLPGAARLASGFHFEDGDAAGDEGGIAILKQLTEGDDAQPGFFPNLPLQRLLGRFPEIGGAPGKCPPQAVAAALQEVLVAAADERDRAAQSAQ